MSETNNTFEYKKDGLRRKALIIVGCLAILAAAAWGWWYWFVRDYHAPTATVTSLTTLAPAVPEPEDFIVEIQDESAVTVEYAVQPDLTRKGEQEVVLLLTDEWENTAEIPASLTVIIDDEGPVIEGVQDHAIWLGQEVDFQEGVTIRDEIDEAPVLTIDDSGVDLTKGGEYEIIYLGTDASGNETVVKGKLTITDDHIAPTILGVQPISLYEGSAVAYRSGILVSDDQDEFPKLTIDSSQVDLSQPGVYEVIYKATDAAGNETVISTTVTVSEKKSSYVDEETIYARADEILSKIVTDDMTEREKVEAIYMWTKRNLKYISTSDKTDWLQAAYTMMTSHRGDCFNFYAVSKLMFDRLGIPNMMVRRSADSIREGKHFWNLVSIDGGETWYHFDTTPRSVDYRGDRDFCLVTDAKLEAFEKYYPGYYTRELSLYPATPEE